jgi:hypothetical protein
MLEMLQVEAEEREGLGVEPEEDEVVVDANGGAAQVEPGLNALGSSSA